MPSNDLRPFEVHPSVIFKLGSDLITDDFQALAELAKNGYDADASRVDISIFTDQHYSINGNRIKTTPNNKDALLGMIEVADDGFGMSYDDIVSGWLTISSSGKKKMKKLGKKTPRKRTPLGDKGLGRLGVQRLGRVLELITKQSGEPPLKVIIDWERFYGDTPLSQIPIEIEELESFPRSHGSTLRIYGLSNSEQWRNKKKIQVKFLDIVSPYSIQKDFTVNLKIDKSLIDLREESQKILDKALLHYELNYKKRRLEFSGLVSNRYLGNLEISDRRREWEKYIQRDGGEEFYRWFSQKNNNLLSFYSIRYDSEPDLLCRFKYAIALDEIDGMDLDEEGYAYDPGDFKGIIDYIARKASRGNYPNSGDVRGLIDAITGVRVYRNGFGIPVDNILPLGAQWTTGRSWYTLRPGNTAGYIDITTEHNSQLVETTNREAFLDNQYYRNFQKILREWLDVSARVQEIIRRDYNKFIEMKRTSEGGFSEESSSKDIAKAAKAGFKKTATALSDHSQSLFVDVTEIQNVERSIKQGTKAVDILAGRVADAEERLDDAWELAALGIIAESVSHEASNVVIRIISEASAIIKRNKTLTDDKEIRNSAIAIEMSANALLKQVSHLDSSLKYVRTKKDEFSVKKFLLDTKDYCETRLKRRNISISINGEDFRVRMNQGRLSQTIDNLINNSEYWLSNGGARYKTSDQAIVIELKRPYVIVYDNGQGVHKSIENSLFDPFVSRKGDGKGRGLGLYICSQLLGTEDCTIALADDRNEHGNRYKFIIDLTNVAVE